MLNKNNLCKPAAKKDTIHNAVIKEFYLRSRREVMGSYASFDAAYYSASTKFFSSGLIIEARGTRGYISNWRLHPRSNNEVIELGVFNTRSGAFSTQLGSEATRNLK